MKNLFTVLILIFALLGCSKDNNTESEIPSNTSSQPNILLVIADDIGKDAINGFTEGVIKPATPNIDAIRNNGLSFTNFWSNPTCTPTRSAILTGKYGYRTGVKGAGDVLSQSETALQQYIQAQTNDSYATAIIGKWHLSGNDATFNPEVFGIDYYAGLVRGAVDDYYQWQFTEDSSTSLQTEYITEVFTDLSIDWIQNQTKPWFLWLAYNAPHTPYHVPPSNMHHQGSLAEYNSNSDPLPYYLAAIEAMDFQIGRLLDSMSQEERENTMIIFIGDNGTPNGAAQSPYSSNKVKNTLYQGGINVPMFVSGSGVSRFGSDSNLITATDLFATISEIAGSTTPQIHDSKSFNSIFSQSSIIRNYQYSEIDDVTGNLWTISNGSYKLIIDANGTEEMYDLLNDPYENNNLLNGNLSTQEQNAKLDLEEELSNIRN